MPVVTHFLQQTPLLMSFQPSRWKVAPLITAVWGTSLQNMSFCGGTFHMTTITGIITILNTIVSFSLFLIQGKILEPWNGRCQGNAPGFLMQYFIAYLLCFVFQQWKTSFKWGKSFIIIFKYLNHDFGGSQGLIKVVEQVDDSPLKIYY